MTELTYVSVETSPLTIGARRQRAQGLAEPRFDDPAAVVAWMGAMQAQDYGQSLWAIASRLREPSMDVVVEAVAAGRILRTWPMRGTIHWVPAADAAWMVAVSASRTVAAASRVHHRLGLTQTIIDRAGDVLAAALAPAGRLTRPEVLALWSAAGIGVEGQHGYHLLWHLAHRGLICIGPMAGKQQTFVLLESWAPDARDLPGAAGLAELAARYLRSHGPASVHDFAWWTGTTVTDARRAVESVDTVEEAAGDRTLLTMGLPFADKSTADAQVNQVPPHGVRLVAGFDEFLLGYQHRGDVLEPAFAGQVVPGNNGIFQPCVVAAGEVVGTWRRIVRAKAVDVAVSLFRPGSIQFDDLAADAERYARFVGVGLGRLSVA